MKKLFIGVLIPSLLFSAGCKKFVEGYDVSPNDPEKATAPLILSATELGVMAVYTGQLARNTATLTQQTGGVSEQMLEVDNYSLREGDNTNDWNNIYYNIVMPCNDIILNYGHNATQHKGVAKIMKAMALGVATDFWGDVPATEAGMVNFDGPEKAKYEKQEQVIAYMQTLLDEGIAHLKDAAAPNVFALGDDDFIHAGGTNATKVARWVNTAWLLKARYANRLSKLDPAGSATKTLQYLANVTDIGDALANYRDNSNEVNQWYAFKNARPNYLVMGEKLVNLMKATTDPRLSHYAESTAAGYVGAAPGSGNVKASQIGEYLAAPAASIGMVTYYEALFIKAEALLRVGGRNAEAATAFNDAVKLHVKKATGADAPADFVTAQASETAATITLEKIMTQKYVAMFAHLEAWADWRRTGFPTLTANPESVLPTKGAIPRRFVTVQTERQYNGENAVLVSDVLARVWWDKQ